MSYQLVGSEILVNTVTVNRQHGSDVAGLSNGGFIVTWTDDSQPAGSPFQAIRAQAYDANGARVGTEFVVNDVVPSGMTESSVAALANGRFVVTWASSQGDGSLQGVRGQVFNADRTKSGDEFLVNTTTTDTQRESSVAALANGGFVVTWSDASRITGDTSGFAVRGQLYSGSGAKVGSEFLINTITTNDQYQSDVTGLSGGGFVVTWTDASADPDGGDTSGFAVRGQVYSAAGAKVGVEFMVNTTTYFYQAESSIAALSGGGFVVTWSDQGSTFGDVRGQVFTASGVKVGAEFVVNTTNAGYQGPSSVAALSDGRFVVAWVDTSETGGDTSGWAIRAQVFAATGEKTGGEFLVNTTTASVQFEPSVAALAGGRFVITWTDQSATGGDTSVDAIRAQIFDPTVYYGGDAGETNIGGALADQLYGYGGDDTLRGEGGNDTLDGGTGLDTAVYSGARANYSVVRLSDGALRITDTRGGSPDGTDTVKNVELFQFSDGAKKLSQVIDITDFNLFLVNSAAQQVRDWIFTNGAVSSNQPYSVPSATSKIIATGDFNGDGISDAIWQDGATGAIREWLLNGSGGIASNISLGSLASNWRILATGDYNGDGQSDLVWQNTSNGDTRIWLMDNGVLATNKVLTTISSDWQLQGTADFNGDGTYDIIWHNTVTGDVREWGIVNGALATNRSLGSLPSQWGIAATGDFNGDGVGDMVWRNTTTGDTRIWEMANGVLARNVVLGAVASSWKIIGAGDYTQDGHDDLIWMNTANGDTRLWDLVNSALTANIVIGAMPASWGVVVNPSAHSDFLPVI